MIGSLEDQSSSFKFTEILSIFLQSHLGVIVDYAEKYGVNIPLNEEETSPVQDSGGIHQEDDDTLAALLQSHFEQTESDLAVGKGLLSNGTIQDQLSSADDDALALKKLIEESLSGHVPEIKETSADPHAPAGLPDFDSKNLASLISEKLKNELEIPTNGFTNHPPAAHAANNGKKPSRVRCNVKSLTQCIRCTCSIYDPAKPEPRFALPILQSRFKSPPAGRGEWRRFTAQPVDAHGCPLRKGPSSSRSQVFKHHAPRRSALHEAAVDT